jgi:hypothetical protein
MRIAVEGCMHGELAKVYDTIQEIESREGYKIDLVISRDNLESQTLDNLINLPFSCYAVVIFSR